MLRHSLLLFRRQSAKPKTLTDEEDQDLKHMLRKAGERAGGVAGDASSAPKVDTGSAPTVPDYLRRGGRAKHSWRSTALH